MSFTKKITFLLTVAFLYACTGDKKPDFLQHATTLQGETVNIDCLIGHPYEIVCMDSLLIFSDPYDQKVLTLFDIKNERLVGRFLSVGNGPGEVILPVRLFEVSKKELGVFLPQSGYVYLFELPEMELREKIFFEDRPVFLKKTGDYYVGTGVFGDDDRHHRYHLYDAAGRLNHTAGEYPFRGKDTRMSAYHRFGLYQGLLCASPYKNFFAQGSAFCDNLEFFRIREAQSSLTKKYETYDADVELRDRGINRMENTVSGYTWAYGAEQYCYFFYCGKSRSEMARKKDFKNHIIVFDWNGNHVRTFETNINIQTFCVDETGHVMYSTALIEGEFVIMRFPLEI
jgi:hypothetical protein